MTLVPGSSKYILYLFQMLLFVSIRFMNSDLIWSFFNWVLDIQLLTTSSVDSKLLYSYLYFYIFVW